MTTQNSINTTFKEFPINNENINKKAPTIPEKPIQDKDAQMLDATKLMIGATALATTIALGVYIARKGKFKNLNNTTSDVIPNNTKPLSQATERTQTPKTETVLPNNQENAKPINNIVEETTENINKTEPQPQTGKAETQPKTKEDAITENQNKVEETIKEELEEKTETILPQKQESEEIATASELSKFQLSKEDIEIKTNMQNILGTEISDDLYLQIKNTPSRYTDERRFYFESLHRYTNENCDIERNCLFMHTLSVIKNIRPETPLEDEILKLFKLQIETKLHNLDINLIKWNTYNYLKKLYEQNPDVNFKNKEQIINFYHEMENNWLSRIKEAELSPQEKNYIMQNLLDFKQGIGYYKTPEQITNADYISAILLAARQKIKFYEQPQNTHLEEIALNLAKKISPSYEEATKLAIEDKYNVSLDLLYRKGDNLMLDRPTKLYDKKIQNFVIDEYVICGDGDGHGAYLLNQILREDGFENAPKHTQEVISRLDTIIKESDKLDKDYIVYRALGFANNSEEWLPWKKVGSVITDKGFVSTAPKNGTYINMFGGRPGESYILRIKLPKGTQGINMNNFNYLANGNNNEYLLPRNSSFKVLGVDESTKVIDLEYLLPE